MLGFPCCKNDWLKFSGNSCEERLICGGPVPASPIGGKTNHGGILYSGLGLK